jgi:hypothetical protein
LEKKIKEEAKLAAGGVAKASKVEVELDPT